MCSIAKPINLNCPESYFHAAKGRKKVFQAYVCHRSGTICKYKSVWGICRHRSASMLPIGNTLFPYFHCCSHGIATFESKTFCDFCFVVIQQSFCQSIRFSISIVLRVHLFPGSQEIIQNMYEKMSMQQRKPSNFLKFCRSNFCAFFTSYVF